MVPSQHATRNSDKTQSLDGETLLDWAGLTVDVRLLLNLGDAEQAGPLLLAALRRLLPRQSGLEVELVAAVGEAVPIPERVTVTAYGDRGEKARVNAHSQR